MHAADHKLLVPFRKRNKKKNIEQLITKKVRKNNKDKFKKILVAHTRAKRKKRETIK